MVKTNSKSGFTMVEVISVLVIIGIMTAVAAPKFIEMVDEARNKAALAGISEAKASLSVAYAKEYLINDGDEPTIGNIHSNVFGQVAAVSDYVFSGSDVKLDTEIAGDVITITATELDGKEVSDAEDTWTKPAQ